MARVWMTVTFATLVGAAGTAAAQPADPYGPAPTPVQPVPAPVPPTVPAPTLTPTPAVAPTALDPALAEQVAVSLVIRAQDLYDARELRDAKQLAVEAVVTSGHGPAADKARALIHQINLQLGIAEEQPPPPPMLPPPLPQPPPRADGEDPSKLTKLAPPDDTRHSGRVAAQVHAGIYLGLIGATVGTAFSDDNQAAGAVPVGLAAGAAGAVFVAPVLDKHLDEAQIRTIGSGTVWGGVIGGLIADIGVSSSGDIDVTSARQAMIGASVGSTIGGLGGYALARQKKLTRGDVALVDTFATIGTFGGLTVGMLMQPAQTEAYDLNAILGATGGIIAGLVAAPQTNTTPRRMLRVAEYAAIGGAAPFLLYAAIYDPNSSGDERVIGALSTVGMVGGLVLGFRATAHWDEGKDVLEGAHDAPPAIVGRASDGKWNVGTPGISPLSPTLDNHQHGMAFTLGSARF